MVVALSGAIRDLLVKYDSRLKPVIIPSMVSSLPVNMSFRNEIRRRYAGKFLVGHAGALVNRHKGQQYLLEAASILENVYPNIHFFFLGQGEDESWLKGLADGLSNVTFTGFIENLGDYLAAFDLFVFPSLQEGLGSVLLDAMQFKLPIVASDVDGIPDIIEHEKTGLLVPPRDGKALSRAIENLYLSGDKRLMLSENAYAATVKYHPREIAALYLSAYKQILSRLI
jgi:glycosyltransferase involved in cell wall biosynthesis